MHTSSTSLQVESAVSQDRRSPHLEMRDESFLAWVVLAIARLHEIIPSGFNRTSSYDFRLREAFDVIGTSFIIATERTSQITSYHRQLLIDFKILGIQAYAAREQSVPDEFIYLYTILETFQESTWPPLSTLNSDGGSEMVSRIAKTWENEVHNAIPMLLQQFCDLPCWSNYPAEYTQELSELVHDHATLVCDLIEEYIMNQDDLKLHEDFDITGEIGQNLVETIHDRLHEYVSEEIQSFLDRVFMLLDPDQNIDVDSWWAKTEIIIYMRGLDLFFSDSSPLLSIFSGGNEYEDEESDQYLEMWEEYEPQDLIDVLPGPDNVAIHQVSLQAPAQKDSICGICFDTSETMLITKACGHEFGEGCLTTQLSTYHPNRYRCAICRTGLLMQGL